MSILTQSEKEPIGSCRSLSDIVAAKVKEFIVSGNYFSSGHDQETGEKIYFVHRQNLDQDFVQSLSEFLK